MQLILTYNHICSVVLKSLKGRKQFKHPVCVILKWLILLLIKSGTINFELEMMLIIIKMVCH